MSDRKQYPSLMMAAPGQVATQPPPSGIQGLREVESGNPNVDPRTGKFTRGPGGVPLEGEEFLELLREEARSYIERIVTQNNANSVRLVKSGTEVAVTIFVNGTPAFAFTVPTKDSPQEVVNQFVGQAGIEGEPVRSSTPPGVDPEVWQRRLDAVRDAAREMDDMDIGDVKDFLKGRVSKISEVDAQAFLKDVREQRLDDLADIFDNQLRGRVEQMKRARRQVKVTAPKGWTRRVFQGLSNNEVVKLMTRMEGKGWDADQLKELILPRVQDEDRRGEIEEQYGERQKRRKKQVNASDDWRGYRFELDGVDMESDVFEVDDIQVDKPSEQQPFINFTGEDLRQAFAEIKPPVINVEIPVTVERDASGRKIVRRDPQTQLINVIEDDPDAG